MRLTIRHLLVVAGALGFAATLAPPTAAADAAEVRVIHASPDAPNVDIWVDGEKVLSDVPFTAASDYLSLPAGAHNIQVTATGATEPVIDADVELQAGMSYTVAATGLLAEIAPVVLTDDRAPAEGKAKLRVFHASPSAPASVDIAVADGTVLVDGLAFGDATDYLTVDPGDYSLEIRAAGEAEAALALDATLEDGQNYTAIAMDGGDAGVQVIVVTEAAAAMPDTALPPVSSAAALVLAGVALLIGAVGTAAFVALRVGR